jgi:hypothetical protein
MGYKSRGNYPVNWCARTECLNRDKECAYCLHFSEYKPPKELDDITNEKNKGK